MITTVLIRFRFSGLSYIGTVRANFEKLYNIVFLPDKQELKKVVVGGECLRKKSVKNILRRTKNKLNRSKLKTKTVASI